MDLSETPAVVLQRHPWELARLDFFRRLIRRKGLHLYPIKVLDVGSGDAWFASNLLPSLAAGSTISCYDPAYSDSQLRSLVCDPCINLMTTRPVENFDLVLLLDVLEHVEKEGEYLRAIVNEVVPRGGILVISLPAWEKLFSHHDVQMHHFRRYQPSAAKRLLLQSGLEIESHGGLFHTLLLPRLLQLVVSQLGCGQQPPPNAGDWRGGPFLTTVVAMFLKVDVRLTLLSARVGIRLPGLSWWALCCNR